MRQRNQVPRQTQKTHLRLERMNVEEALSAYVSFPPITFHCIEASRNSFTFSRDGLAKGSEVVCNKVARRCAVERTQGEECVRNRKDQWPGMAGLCKGGRLLRWVLGEKEVPRLECLRGHYWMNCSYNQTGSRFN